MLSVTTPLTESPPTTVAELREIDTSAAPPTVSAAVLLLPLIDAVIVALPGEIAVTVNTPLDEPAARHSCPLTSGDRRRIHTTLVRNSVFTLRSHWTCLWRRRAPRVSPVTSNRAARSR